LRSYRATQVGIVLQDPLENLLPYATVAQNVVFAGRGARAEARAGRGAPPPPTQLLDVLGIAHLANRKVTSLSGGEQQRVALARAFVLEPPIVLADEPTGNLDSANGQHVLELLGERQRESQTTLVLVTHDPQIAERADRRIQLKDGLVVADDLQGLAVQAGAPSARSSVSGR
jgi:putative ABC transport system ATP-binding protein